MDAIEVIRGVFADYWQRLDQTLDGLNSSELSWKPNPQSNSIGFLVWHLARVEDTWMTIFAQGTQDVWVSDLWYERFQMPEKGIGFRVSQEWLDAFPELSLESLNGYRRAVHGQTQEFFSKLNDSVLDKIPGRTPLPEMPETLDRFGQWSVGRMLRQVMCEMNQHLGQIQYIRGIQRGLDPVTRVNSL